jgi:3-methyladenine DNA glycosylase AlkC
LTGKKNKISTKEHPSQQFQAPDAILQGVPLKDLMGLTLVRLITQSFAEVVPKFDGRSFEQTAMEGLEALELSQRARQIGLALAEQLPQSFSEACPLLLASFGPELTRTEGNGLAPFFYLPHSHVIMERGLADFDNGMRANYELTKRFSAEFSIRPFLTKYPDQSLKLLKSWTKDSNAHVRRLVSEGTRPRLPWAGRLQEFQQNPQRMLPLLDMLKDDPELYVRRSVANHLADILKDHPDVIYETCEQWLKEIAKKSTPAEIVKSRKWMIRHAVRLPAKKGDARALELRVKAS